MSCCNLSCMRKLCSSRSWLNFFTGIYKELAFKRIIGLLWIDILGGYAVWILQTYLTSVWGMGLKNAAAIVNVTSGLSKAVPLLFLFMMNCFQGFFYRVLLLSSISFTLGLGFLTLSTPPVLAKSANRCSEYKPECVGPTQKALFYIALPLIVVGMAGHIVSLLVFSKAQANEKSPKDQLQGQELANDQRQDDASADEFQTVLSVLSYVTNHQSQGQEPANDQQQDDASADEFQPVASVLAYVTNHQKHKFWIGLLVLVPAIAVLVLPYITPWWIRFGVPAIGAVVATTFFVTGRNYKPVTKGDQNQFSREVAIRLIAFCATFVIFGMITSLGNTYFVEQSKNMSFKVGAIKAPATILLSLQQVSKGMSTQIYNRIYAFFDLVGFKRRVPAFGIGIAILFSGLCCVTAALIEKQRIHVIKTHGLLDKPDDKIPMSAFWLVFQFMLLGCHDSLAETSSSAFFEDEVPASMKRFVVYFTQAVSGGGTVGTVLLVYVVGKISENGGHPSWFQYTSNRSRLDNFYWVLAGVSVANLLWYTISAKIYFHVRKGGKHVEDSRVDAEATGYRSLRGH